MKVYFAEPASIEFDDAFEYYELQLPGLGKKFFSEVFETIELISQFPQLWSQNSEHTRKAVLRKFPYNLIYSILNDKLYIIAVAHQNRAPEYWINRMLKDE
ncbi:MAG TPA: plasmid stabilization protein [Ignavibacteriales bacterium]|nr:plasmid stabilization protein [Ignavibacteriales bacterium]